MLLLSVVVAPALAADNPDGSFSLVVSPVPLALEAKPGTETKTEVKVKNTGLATEHVKISLMKFGAEGEEGTPKLEAIGPNDEFAKWMNLSENRFDAEPEVWKTIKVTLDVPKEAAFGYYYALVFSRDNAEKQIQNDKANLLGAVASLVLVNVDAQGAKRDTTLEEFSLGKKLYEFLPIDFTVRLHNTGNTHAAPRGNIFITKGSKNVGLLEVNAEQGYLLPGTFRRFQTSWTDGAPVYKVVSADGKVVLDESGKQKSKLDWGSFSPSKIRFGKYTAHLVMVYNDGKSDIPLEGTVTFWVIPWRILAVLLVVLILVFVGLYAAVIRPLRTRIKKRKDS